MQTVCENRTPKLCFMDQEIVVLLMKDTLIFISFMLPVLPDPQYYPQPFGIERLILPKSKISNELPIFKHEW